MEFSRPGYWSGSSFPSLGESSQPRDWFQISHIAGEFFTSQATREERRALSKIKREVWLQTNLPGPQGVWNLFRINKVVKKKNSSIKEATMNLQWPKKITEEQKTRRGFSLHYVTGLFLMWKKRHFLMISYDLQKNGQAFLTIQIEGGSAGERQWKKRK